VFGHQEGRHLRTVASVGVQADPTPACWQKCVAAFVPETTGSRQSQRHDQTVNLGGQLNLRYLLNEWDPIGVAEIAPDEYDRMVGPLLVRLRAGAGRAEISEYLWFELERHFGLDPTPYDVDGMANRLVAWWSVAASDDDAAGC
jgi:hypothetical protein